MKKCVSLLLSVLLCLAVFLPMSATAVAEPTILIGSTAGRAGDTVSVTISVQNNPGVVALQLQASFDNTKLQLTNAEDGGILGSGTASFGNLRRVPFSLTWDDSSSSSNHTDDGAVAVLTFLILETAEPGNAAVTVSVVQAGTFNVDLDDVIFQTVNGIVTIQPDILPTAVVSVGSATATAGENIDIPITIAENPGMIAMLLSVNYDAESLQLTGVTDGSIFGAGDSSFGNDYSRVPYKLLWENGATHSNYTQNGTLAVLHFHVLESATEGTVDVTLQYEQDSTFDIDLNDIALSLQGGQVTVEQAEEPPANLPTICVESCQAVSAGNTFTLPIKMQNNPGMIATAFSIDYDSDKLELIGAAAATEVFPSGSALMTNNLSQIPFKILFEDGVTHSNYVDDGVLATLTFRVKENAPLGETQITITIDNESTFDVDLNDVAFQSRNAMIAITDGSSVIFAKDNSATIMKDGYVYGLTAGITSLEDYVSVKDGFTLEYDSAAKIGTGLILTAKKNNTIYETRVVVIFGDVDGDGWYNGTDAYFVSLVANGLLPASVLTDAQSMAADCNHDGNIDAMDVALLEQAGLLLANVDQTMPGEELQTDSVYLEYCSLIDQSIEISEPDQPDVTDEPTAEQGSAASVWQLVFDLFKRFVNFITMIFSIIVLPK